MGEMEGGKGEYASVNTGTGGSSRLGQMACIVLRRLDGVNGDDEKRIEVK